MAAALMGEPWLYRPWEIARLTDYQIWLLAYPRDKEGRLKPRTPAQGEAGPLLGEDLVLTGEDEMRQFFEASQAWGVPREQAEKEWTEKRGPIDNPPPWLVVLRANWR